MQSGFPDFRIHSQQLLLMNSTACTLLSFPHYFFFNNLTNRKTGHCPRSLKSPNFTAGLRALTSFLEKFSYCWRRWLLPNIIIDPLFREWLLTKNSRRHVSWLHKLPCTGPPPQCCVEINNILIYINPYGKDIKLITWGVD